MLSNIFYPEISFAYENQTRPFWSVMIPTYNGTKYLDQTIKSVLDQAPNVEEMQIEVVDDCSTQEDIETFVREIGKGRVSFYRNPQNLGLLGNWDNCIRRARGHWVHLLHQDDFVLPGFYQTMKAGLETQPTVGAGLCRHAFIDEDSHWTHLSPIERRTPGILENWIEQIAVTQRVQFPAIVVKREVYEKLGGFCPEAASAADWEMWKRIVAHYPIWYEPKILACFRRHSDSTSSGLIRRGENIADTYKAIDISKNYLPPPLASILTQQARRNYAKAALGMAHGLLAHGELDAAISQFKQGVKFLGEPRNLMSAVSFSIKFWKLKIFRVL